MTITEIKYGYTFNKGDYSSERIDATASLAEGDDITEALKNLKEFVHYGQISKKETAPEKTVVENKTSDTGDTKKSEPKPKKAKADKVTEPVKEATATEEKEETVTPPSEEKTEEAPVETKAKKLRVKATTYDRTNDLHKKLLGEVLDSVAKTWRDDAAIKAKAAAASKNLTGEPFLTEDGSVLEEFRKKIVEAMK